MLSLEKLFYGLSRRGWIIIITLICVFLLFSFISEETFTNSENKNSNLVKVYNFNTSWCGYSVRFQPEWDKFQKEVTSRNDLLNINAYDIKCDIDDNKQMCIDYEITGFPSIIIEINGKKINYNGERTSDALIETIKKLLLK